MSQMNNKKPGNWKSATPAGLKTQKAMDQVKQTTANLNRAEQRVQNAGPGQHHETLKHLQHADQAQTSAVNQYSRLKEQSDKIKKPTQGQTIGAQRTAPPKPTTPSPTAKPGLGGSGAKPLMGKLGNMLGKKK